LINTQQTVLPWWGERWHVPAFATFVASSILYILAHSVSHSVPDWVRAFVLVTAFITSLVTLGRQLPLQNVVAIALIFALAAVAWDVATNHLGFRWREPLWRKVIFWSAALITLRGGAQFLLRSRRAAGTYGWELIAIAGAIFGAIAHTLYKRFYVTALAMVACLVLLIVTLPLFINKRPAEPPAGWQPVVILPLLLLWAVLPRI
jgi:uncharacterized membrane protein YoaK (UPF0700 family)